MPCPICHTPLYAKDSSSSVRCALAPLDGKPVGEIANACTFSCFPSTELQAQQLDYFTIVLTNVAALETICPTVIEKRKLELIGAVQVRITLGCTMIVNNVYKISPPIFYLKNRLAEDDIIQLSPNLWSRFDNAIGHSNQYYKSQSN